MPTANDIDPLVHRDNDENISCTPTIDQFNATTGAEESSSLHDREDGVYFLSLKPSTDPTAVAIHAELIVTFTESLNKGVYFGVQQGSDKTTRLADIKDDTILHRHYKFGQDYHVSVPATLSARTVE